MPQPPIPNSQLLSGFYSEAVSPSGNEPYYQIVNPVRQENQPLAPEALIASSSVPYYALKNPPISDPSNITQVPISGVVSNPALSISNSKVLSSSPYGAASNILPGAAEFGIQGIQYAKDSSYFVSKSSSNVNPPNFAPGVPQIASAPGQTSIIGVFFNVAGVTAFPSPVFSFLYGTTNPPTIPAPATLAFGSLYTGSFTGLTPNTTYYFSSVATNVAGSLRSGVLTLQTPSTTGLPINKAPTVPLVGTVTSSSIAYTFDAANVIGSPLPTFSIQISTLALIPDNAPTFVATLQSGTTYGGTITGLSPNTTFYIRSMASNGVIPSQYSLATTGILTPAAPAPPPFTTNMVTTFLIQGPRFNTAYQTALDYYINVDAIGCTYNPTLDGTLLGAQIYGSMFAGSLVSGTATTQAGMCLADKPYTAPGSAGYGTVTDAYFASTRPSGTRLLTSLGGFNADVLGLFGPANWTPTGFPGTLQRASDVMRSFLSVYCNVSSTTNPLNWTRTGSGSSWATVFDGLVLDFENIGFGGVPGTSNQYPPPQATAPVFPADVNAQPVGTGTAPYNAWIVELADIPVTYYTQSDGGQKYLANAPASLSINGDAIGSGVSRGGNVSACNTALNQWFAFANSSVIPSATTYNNQTTVPAIQALNHPRVMQYFDDVFVQFYNEASIDYLGGKNFPTLLAQWGYVALLAQQQAIITQTPIGIPGRQIKVPRINIGLAKGTIIPGYNNSGQLVQNGQGPTFGLGNPPNTTSGGGAPYTYWAPQYATDSPPNYTKPDGWPNTGPEKDARNLAEALETANSYLKAAFGNADLKTSDWCSGAGFWASGEATTMAQRVYTYADKASPGAGLPAITTFLWSDASYPSPDTLWPANVPITVVP
jgi:hypothetical protein